MAEQNIRGRLSQLLNMQSFLTQLGEVNLLSFASLYTYVYLDKYENLGELKRELAKRLVTARTQLGMDKVLEEVKKALESNGFHVKVLEFKSTWRSLVGASESSFSIPFEVGLFWDPVYNLPFIPGTSIKGAVRMAFAQLLAKRLNIVGTTNQVKDSRVLSEVARVFGEGGESGHAGLVGFVDAYPIKYDERLLDPDVVTPHYQDAKNELEAQPIPNVFIAMSRGITFRTMLFYVPPEGIPGRRESKKHTLKVVNSIGDNSGLADIFRGNLASQIKDTERLDPDTIPLLDLSVLYAFAMGVGAKTSVGYSRFEVIKYE